MTTRAIVPARIAGPGRVARLWPVGRAVAGAILALALPVVLTAADAPAVVTVTAKRLLDVDSGRLLANAVVRIENGVVVSVATRKAGEAVTHDLGDVTLLPGLIDSHTHLVGG